MAKESALESKQTLGKTIAVEQAKMDELNVRNQDKKPVRKNSTTSDVLPEGGNTIESQNTGPERLNIRHRHLPEVIPPNLLVARKASRRLSDEFDDVPTKRARHVSLLIRHKQQRDGRPQEHHNLSLTNFEPTKYTSGFSPYDVSIRGDVLQSPEYVSDIFQRLYHSEVRALLDFVVEILHHILNDILINIFHFSS